VEPEQIPQTQVVVQQPGVTKDDLESLKLVFEAKMSSLKAWGVAAFLGGQALAGVVGAVVAPHQTGEVAASAARMLLPF